MDEFNIWWVSLSDQDKIAINNGIYGPRFIWDEATRRADKRAREECCEIIRNERVANECACESDEAYNLALTHAEQEIRATIQEPQP